MKNYCPLPFRHVFVEPRGIKPCCSYTQLHNGDIDSWLSSPELAKLQENIVSGNIDSGCKSCIESEKKTNSGTRSEALNNYGVLDNHTTSIDYIDYRSSNICNFRCRSCDPFYSNGIAQEARRNPTLQKFYPIPKNKVAPTTVKDKDWILNNIHRIKKLMFTGGEPTKIAEVKEIIEVVHKRGLKDINLLITSNASFEDSYWVEITETMPNLHWTLSLDAVGSHAEIIRDGTKWNVVSANIEKMFDIASSVNIGTVVTNLSLPVLDKLFVFANNLEKKYNHRRNGRTQLIEICHWPDYMTPYNWPDAQKEKLLVSLKSWLSLDLQDKQRHTVNSLIENISNTPFDQLLWQKTLDFNSALDAVREKQALPLLQML